MLKTDASIDIALPREIVWKIYLCHDRLPLWAPGFQEMTLVHGIHGEIGSVYRYRYTAMDKTIEERLTLLTLDAPHTFCTRADNQGNLFRESHTRFDVIHESTTRITVQNHFWGNYLPHLVHSDIEAYTLQFLEIFKGFVEGRSEK